MSDKKINKWHEAITPRDKAPQPWTTKSGGSWDMLDVQPIPDEMLADLARLYNRAGAPWNCRSMPLSEGDREYMFLLYYSMQGLVARMRAAEKALADAQASPAMPSPPSATAEHILTPEHVMRLYDQAIGRGGSADNIILNTAWSIEAVVLAALKSAAPVAPSGAQEPAAYVNGDELANILDDRTATIVGEPSNYCRTPLYTAPVPAIAPVQVKTWQERLLRNGNMGNERVFMEAEIADLRAALAAKAEAPNPSRGDHA